MALPLIAAGLAALEVPFALGGARDLLEDVGFDPTGRRRRAGNQSLSSAMVRAGQGLGGTATDLTEEALAAILDDSGGDPWEGMGGLSADAEAITRPYRSQLAALSEGAPRQSLTSLMARAGLL